MGKDRRETRRFEWRWKVDTGIKAPCISIICGMDRMRLKPEPLTY